MVGYPEVNHLFTGWAEGAAESRLGCPRMAQMLADEYTRTMQKKGMDDSYELLSAREREVLQLLAAGKSNKEAGEILNVSVYTVETHRTHIMQKLNLHNTAELVLYAVRKKIIV